MSVFIFAIIGFLLGVFLLGNMILTSRITFRLLKQIKSESNNLYPQIDVIYKKGVYTKISNCIIIFIVFEIACLPIIHKVNFSDIGAFWSFLALGGILILAKSSIKDNSSDFYLAYSHELATMETPEQARMRNSNSASTRYRFIIIIVLVLIPCILTAKYLYSAIETILLFYPATIFICHWKDMFSINLAENKPMRMETQSAQTFVGEIPGYLSYSELIGSNHVLRLQIGDSVLISEIEYIPNMSILLVTFTENKGTYGYYGIDENTWVDFYNATYKSNFFHDHIKSRYSYQKVMGKEVK